MSGVGNVPLKIVETILDMADEGLRKEAIKALRAIANGTPAPTSPTGLCKAVRERLEPKIGFTNSVAAYHLVSETCRKYFCQDYVFPIGDFGPNRRTLAGFLAAVLETEL